MTDRVDRLLIFMKNTFPKGIQMFDTRNWTGDRTERIYTEDGISVDFCPGYMYVEIFGLTDEEFRFVESKCGETIY